MVEGRFQRDTLQRRIILEELESARDHPTAAKLHERVRRRLPKISLGTVYRNLDLFAELGTIQRVLWSGPEARFDGNPDHHDHLRCVRCGKIEDAHSLPGDPVGGCAIDAKGYRILGHRLEFFGICPACRQVEVETDDAPSEDNLD